MWNKLSLQLRVTILGGVCLLAVCTLLMGYLVMSAGEVFYTPYESIALITKDIDMEKDNPSRWEPVPKEDLKSTEANPKEIATVVNIEYHAAQRRYLWISVIGTIILGALGTLAIWLVSSRAIKSVSVLSEQIEEIDENHLNTPLTVPEAMDEVRRLTVSFNHMLSRIGNSYEAQKRFAHNAAHELKTPVANMLTIIEVSELDESSGAEELKETLSDVKAEVFRLKELIADMMLLNVSTIEKTQIDFLSLYKEIAEELEPDCFERGVSISCNGNTVLLGDWFLLKRAFFNLLQNAVRYNILNGTVTVSCEADKIVIADTGIGIPTKHLDHIWEPFYCVDPSRSRKLGGSGLGLSIVKQILDKHEIEIEIKSSTSGTTVTVLPNSIKSITL